MSYGWDKRRFDCLYL